MTDYRCNFNEDEYLEEWGNLKWWECVILFVVGIWLWIWWEIKGKQWYKIKEKKDKQWKTTLFKNETRL